MKIKPNTVMYWATN